MWSKLFFILWLIHSTIAQDLLDTPPFFFPENQLGQSFGTSTQLKASGDTSSDSNHENVQQEQWTEDPNSIFLAGAGCNDANAAPNQVLYSRSRRTFTRRGGGEICIPDDRAQLFKQPEEAQPPEIAGTAQPLPLDPTSGKPRRPGKRKKPAKGISGDALPMYNAIYNFPGEDGKPDYEVCNVSEYPLLRVPICAPPQPYSPISMVLPARFCKFLLFSFSFS